MTDEQMRLILLGVEFGYREYEKGNNLQRALETAKTWMTRDPNRCAVCGHSCSAFALAATVPCVHCL